MTEKSKSHLFSSVQRVLDMRDIDFIDSSYMLILGRPVDPSGRWNFITKMASGESRAKLLLDIVASDEGKLYAGKTPELYEALITALRDCPSSSEPLTCYSGSASLANTSNERAPALEFLSNSALSVKFNHSGSSPSIDDIVARDGSDFVEFAFKCVLGRTADAQGREHYLCEYHSGESKIAIINAIAKSEEGRVAGRNIVGLRGAIRRLELLRLPILGPLFAALTGAESQTTRAKKARAVLRKGYR